MQEGQTGFISTPSWLLQASKFWQSHRAQFQNPCPAGSTWRGGGSPKAGKSTAAGLWRGYRDSTAGKYLWRKDADLCMFSRLEMVLIYLLQRLWLFAAGFCWKQLFEALLLPLVSQLCSWARTKHSLNSHKLQGILLFSPPLEKRKSIIICISDYPSQAQCSLWLKHAKNSTDIS